MDRIEIPTPSTMEKGDIIARHKKHNIGVGGVPFVFNLETHALSWGGEECDPEEFLSLARRIKGALHPETQTMAPANYVGSRMTPAEIDEVSRDMKFAGVGVWLTDHFSDPDKLEKAREMLENLKQELASL